MPDYVIQALQQGDQDRRAQRESDIKMQSVLQAMHEQATQFAQAQEDRKRQAIGLGKEADLYSQLPPPSGSPAPMAPPAQGMPQAPAVAPSPAPGAASAPNAPPGGPAPAVAPPGAQMPPGAPTGAQNAVDASAHRLEQILGQRGPAQVKVSPQGQISATPPGWKPSPAAPTALGGGAPAGGPPAPAGGVSAPPGLGGGMPGGGMQGPKIINPMEEIGKWIKQDHLTPEEAGARGRAMLPMWNQMNKQAVEEFATQSKIAAQVIQYQDRLLRDADAKKRLEQGQAGLDERTRHDRAMEAARGGGAAAGGAAGQTGLSPGAVDLAAQQYLTTGQMPPLGFANAALRAAILNRAADLQAQAGESTASVPGKRAQFKANQTALTQLTKDLTAIAPYQAMLEKNADIAIDLASKVAKTNTPLANKSINWLEQNAAGDPDTAEYLAQVRIVQTEAARVLNNPRLVGQLTDSARHEMEGVVNGNMNLSQTKSVLGRLKQDGQNRVNAMEDQSKKLRSEMGAGGTQPGTQPTASSPREFATEAEAKKANLKPGTRIKIGGVSGTWQ